MRSRKEILSQQEKHIERSRDSDETRDHYLIDIFEVLLDIRDLLDKEEKVLDVSE